MMNKPESNCLEQLKYGVSEGEDKWRKKIG
jgi:hypothetical protein